MATPEQELQSLLLRFSILLASSLALLDEPLPPTILNRTASSTNKSTSNQLGAQIYNDFCALFTSTQKCCTNLTLALRPSGKGSKAMTNEPIKSEEVGSSTSGLDLASLQAASAQVADMIKEHIPKIVWLTRKASAEAVVYEYVPKTAVEREAEEQERAFVKSRGGHIVQYAHSREQEKLQKVRGRGLGLTWARAIQSVTVELLDALNELSETLMNERTMVVLQKASEARRAKESLPGGPTLQRPNTRTPATSQDEARQKALQATAAVWQICDVALKQTLPKDNREAVTKAWKSRTEMLQDALNEFTEALQDDDKEPDAANSENDDLDELQNLTLSSEEKERAKKFEILLRAACQLHSTVGQICLGVGQESGDVVLDFDELEEAGKAISSAVDHLVSSLLYDEADDDEETKVNDSEEAGELHTAMQALQNATERLHSSESLLTTKTNKRLDSIKGRLEEEFAKLLPVV